MVNNWTVRRTGRMQNRWAEMEELPKQRTRNDLRLISPLNIQSDEKNHLKWLNLMRSSWSMMRSRACKAVRVQWDDGEQTSSWSLPAGLNLLLSRQRGHAEVRRERSMSVGSGGFESKAAVQWQMRRLLVLPATTLFWAKEKLQKHARQTSVLMKMR